MTAGQGQIGEIDIERLVTLGAVVRGIRDQEINRTPGFQIAQIMQSALARFVAIGQVPTSQARTVVEIAVVRHDDGGGQVIEVDDALGRIGDIFTRSEHGVSPEGEGSDG